MPRATANHVYRLKVTLAEIQPPVWRRLLVPAEMSLAKLHRVLQDAMGWTNSHLHCFELEGRRIALFGSTTRGDAREDVTSTFSWSSRRTRRPEAADASHRRA